MSEKSVSADHKVQYAQISWDSLGQPRSILFDDKYFCQEDGYKESKYIFCGGNNLEERFKQLSLQGSENFIIGETGFGTGLNFLSAWEMFDQHAPKQARLHYISIDQYPLHINDIQRAINCWPELALYLNQFALEYPNIHSKLQNVYFLGGRIKFTLIFDHVVSALAKIKKEGYKINAWFLDGFAPSKNSEMWSPDVFSGIAQLSQIETTIATFTVAGGVRRGLNEQGFIMVKAPGFGRKRQMLKGVYQK